MQIPSKNIPKNISHCICLSVILIDSVFRTGKSYYYPQVFLEEFKYVANERRCLSPLLTTQNFIPMILNKKGQRKISKFYKRRKRNPPFYRMKFLYCHYVGIKILLTQFSSGQRFIILGAKIAFHFSIFFLQYFILSFLWKS